MLWNVNIEVVQVGRAWYLFSLEHHHVNFQVCPLRGVHVLKSDVVWKIFACMHFWHSLSTNWKISSEIWKAAFVKQMAFSKVAEE